MTKQIRKMTAAVPFATVKAFVLDLAFLAGLGVVVYGISLMHKPAAVIFAGVALSAVAFLATSGRE